MAAFRNAMALAAFSLGKMSVKAMREPSSMQNMDVFLTDATRIALARPVASDPVAEPLEATEA